MLLQLVSENGPAVYKWTAVRGTKIGTNKLERH